MTLPPIITTKAKAIAAAVIAAVIPYLIFLISGGAFNATRLEVIVITAVAAGIGVHITPNAKARTVLGSHPTRKLGALPAKVRLPRFSDYVNADAPPVDYLTKFTGWLMLGNDSFGDCVAVAIANIRALITTALTGVTHYPGLAAVVAFYQTQATKFDPNGTKNTNGPGSKYDTGMDPSQALVDLCSIGIDGVTAVAAAQVDHTNLATLRLALSRFGALLIAITVTDANQQEFEAGQPWDYIPSSPDDGGHGICVGGHLDQTGNDLRFITWAQETAMTELFETHQIDFAGGILWPEHLESAEFMAGMDVATLITDWNSMTGQNVPVPVTPTPAPPSPDVDAADQALAVALHEAEKSKSTPKYLATAASTWLADKGL